MKIINLTPHPITVLAADGSVIATYPSDGVLRLPEVTEEVGTIGGIPIVRKSLGNLDQLPPVLPDTYYIVSLPIAQAVRRDDFIVPDDLVRDEQGRVLGCRRFAVMA